MKKKKAHSLSESKSIHARWIENKIKNLCPQQRKEKSPSTYQRRLADDVEQSRTARILYIEDIVFLSSILCILYSSV